MNSYGIRKTFQIFYTVSTPTNNWKGGVGHISKDMVEKGLPSPGDDTLILVSVTTNHKRFFLVMTIESERSKFLFFCLLWCSI